MLAVVAFCSGVMGCSDEIDASTIEATAVAHGVFALDQGRTSLVESTTRIACETGTLFGVDYVVEAKEARFGGVLPIEFRWRHPELAVPAAKIWGTETPAGASNPRIDWGVDRIEGRALWHLEHPEELVPGRYEFVIREAGGGRVLLSQRFEIEGC